MLNRDDNENGFKTNRSNYQKTNCTCSRVFLLISKKQICMCCTPFSLSLCRCFARLQRCFIPVRACLHEGGGPQIGVLTCGGSPHLSCQRDQIKMRDHVDRRVTSPTRGPHAPCKQALRERGIYKMAHPITIVTLQTKRA